MGIVKTRRCDVTYTGLNVKSYRLRLDEVTRAGNAPGEEIAIKTVDLITHLVLDLSPRGLKRLNKFIHTGTTPMKNFRLVKPDEQDNPEEAG